MNFKDEVIALIRSGVMPALGCTEPGAVAHPRVGHRQRTFRLSQERRETSLQARGVRSTQRRCRA